MLDQGEQIMSKVNVSIRIDAELKKQADTIFADMGLNMTTVMNMFLRHVVRQGRIPFEVATDIPNAETVAAIQEMDDMINGNIPAKRYTSTDELFKDLDA